MAAVTENGVDSFPGESGSPVREECCS